MADRQKFLQDFAKLLTKHKIENTLIVYLFGGEVCNTTLNLVENDSALLLNNMSDAIDEMFRGKTFPHNN